MTHATRPGYWPNKYQICKSSMQNIHALLNIANRLLFQSISNNSWLLFHTFSCSIFSSAFLSVPQRINAQQTIICASCPAGWTFIHWLTHCMLLPLLLFGLYRKWMTLTTHEGFHHEPCATQHYIVGRLQRLYVVS